MILNMNGGGSAGAGTGAGLNFKVVGGTSAPSNPAENTIWVNTSTAITGWTFSATEPENPAEGMVWITTGAYSPVEFNALKKNGIMVYPMDAKQYVGGAWVDKTVKIYQGSVWKGLDLYLLDGGNKYNAITGGWVSANSICKLFNHQSGTTSGVATQNTNGLTFGSDNTIVYTAKKIDLTDYNTLNVHISSNNGVFLISVKSAISGSLDTSYAAYKYVSGSATGIISVDISSVKGEYYIAIGQDGAYRGTVSKAWLEV